jgi:hypothetical protein
MEQREALEKSMEALSAIPIIFTSSDTLPSGPTGRLHKGMDESLPNVHPDAAKKRNGDRTRNVHPDAAKKRNGDRTRRR